jgi:hypothetical protein
MRSTTAVRSYAGVLRNQMSGKYAGQMGFVKSRRAAEPPILLLTIDATKPAEPQPQGGRYRWSEAGLWAWEDLNLRLHPYQQSRAYRCATLRFCRSHATVRGEVMRSSMPATSWSRATVVSSDHATPAGSPRCPAAVDPCLGDPSASPGPSRVRPDGTVALSRKTPTKPSELEAHLIRRPPRRTRTTRSWLWSAKFERRSGGSQTG